MAYFFGSFQPTLGQIHALAYYQMPDSSNPLSWGAVRENIERASNEDFFKKVGSLGKGKGTIAKIQRMFLKRPSISSGDPERPGFIQPNTIERPGFIN